MLPPQIRCGVVVVSVLAALSTSARATEFAAAGGLVLQLDALWAEPHPDFPDSPTWGDFIRHVEQGNAADVSRDIKVGANTNLAGRNGYRPIFFALAGRSTAVEHMLLAAGADPNARLKDGSVPLQLALANPNADVTRELLAAGAAANVAGAGGRPVIHYAVQADRAEQIQLLSKKGADLDAMWDGKTPLMAAISGNRWRAATALVDAGANIAWRQPGKKGSAAEAQFCAVVAQEHKPDATTRTSMTNMFDAFKRRGVKLACAGQAKRFK